MNPKAGDQYRSVTTGVNYFVIGNDPVEPWKVRLEDAQGYNIGVGIARLKNSDFFVLVVE